MASDRLDDSGSVLQMAEAMTLGPSGRWRYESWAADSRSQCKSRGLG